MQPQAINTTTLTGRLGADPRLQQVEQLGRSVAIFSLAVLGARDKPTLW